MAASTPAGGALKRLTRKCLPPTSFLLVALWLTAPTLTQLHSSLPTGATRAVTVPLFNVWTIWWNCDRLAHGFAGYWDAPIFHPVRGTFAFSEPQPATLLVAPVVWASGSAIVAYKAYLVLSLVLNGLFTYRLVRHLGSSRSIAVVAGTLTQLLPVVHQQLEVLQLVPVWGILWTWDALNRLGRRPTPVRGLESGLAVGVTFALSVHHGLFLVLLLPLAVILLVQRGSSARLWGATAVAVLTAGLCTAPLLLPIRTVSQKHQLERSPDSVQRLSLQLIDHAVMPPQALVRLPGPDGRAGWEYHSGYLRWLLAAMAVGIAIRRRRLRGWLLFLVLTTVASVLLSLGMNLRLGTWQPWAMLAWWVPGVGQVRNVFRFVYFAQLAVTLLAASGLTSLHLLLLRRFKNRRWRMLATGVPLLLGLAAVVEIPPARFLSAGVPSLAAHTGWTDVVRDQTPPGTAIACLPFAEGHLVQDFEITTRWMYYGSLHGKPLVNGYSGFFPESYFQLRRVVNDEFPSAPACRQLAAAGVELVVIQRAWLTPQQIAASRLEGFRLQPVHADPVGIDVYHLIAPSGEVQ